MPSPGRSLRPRPAVARTAPKLSTRAKFEEISKSTRNNRKHKAKIPRLARAFPLKPTITHRRQSPIDIKSEAVCHDPEHCKPDSLSISYNSGDCHDVVCNDHGFQVNVGSTCNTTLSASHLPGTYQLKQFHAHWSKDGSCGSEHLLNGKAMSGEVHFVFWNTRYGSFCTATEKDDGLAVLAVFIKEGNHSRHYEPLFDVVRRAIDARAPIHMPKDFVLDQLLPPPDERDYVTYLGSLTTPPYSETVIWTVLTTPVEVSKEQLNIPRKIIPANFRECQKLCDREIKASSTVKV